jgi:inward rectifier potassium channel
MKKHSKPLLPEDEFKDLGFGAKAAGQAQRLINRDGSFNVERKGLPFFESLSFYHYLISISWLKFNLIVLACYIVINAVFASIYLLIGTTHLSGIMSSTPLEKFWDVFFFSVQTFTTVGYGRVSPIGFDTGVVSALESLVGLMSFALATGLIYGRFSRPNAKIIYSRNAVIAPYRDITAFEFRLANARENQLIEVEMQVILSMKTFDGNTFRRKFQELKLERSSVNFFSLSWTIVHPIDEESPMNGMTKEDFMRSDAEFYVLLKAFDDAFSQTVHSRTSYKFHEVVWGAKFASIFVDADQGRTAIDMSRLHDIEKVKMD